MNQMYEFESRWTRGMKSRWTDHLDEPTLPRSGESCLTLSVKMSQFKSLSAPVIKPGRHEYFPRIFQEQENCWALLPLSWPKLWRWTEDNFWILRNSSRGHMEIWMGKKMGKKQRNVQAVSFTSQHAKILAWKVVTYGLYKRENCNKWVQKGLKQKVSLSPIRQLKKSDKKLMILGPGQKTYEWA